MRALWVNPRFLDYRVPVYAALDALLGGQLTVVYSAARTPERVARKLESALGERAIGLKNERIWEFGRTREHWANASLRIPYQPGLLRAILGARPDVVLGEGFFQWTPAALLASRLRRVPMLVVYERTRHTERNCPRWRSAYRRLMIPWLDGMICSGTACATYAESLGMPAAHIATGHMSADVETLQARAGAVNAAERESFRRTHGITGTAYLFVGRLIELKGVAQLLRAWERFEAARAGLHGGAATLLIAGDGPERAALEAYARDHGLAGVRFLGAVDYDALAPVYASSDLFVLPTLEDNWALVVPEAMACGLPILCSRYNGGCPDLIRENVNGWTFDPLDIEDTVKGLTRALDQRERLAAMGAHSRAIVAAHTPARSAASIYECCRAAIERRGGLRHCSPATIRPQGTL